MLYSLMRLLLHLLNVHVVENKQGWTWRWQAILHMVNLLQYSKYKCDHDDLILCWTLNAEDAWRHWTECWIIVCYTHMRIKFLYRRISTGLGTRLSRFEEQMILRLQGRFLCGKKGPEGGGKWLESWINRLPWWPKEVGADVPPMWEAKA